MSKPNGGPAFPVSTYFNHSTGKFEGLVAGGLTKRELFAASAPATEISDIFPGSNAGCAELLGIPAHEYKTTQQYLQVLAILRYQWADAMLAEAENGGPDAE